MSIAIIYTITGTQTISQREQVRRGGAPREIRHEYTLDTVHNNILEFCENYISRSGEKAELNLNISFSSDNEITNYSDFISAALDDIKITKAPNQNSSFRIIARTETMVIHNFTVLVNQLNYLNLRLDDFTTHTKLESLFKLYKEIEKQVDQEDKRKEEHKKNMQELREKEKAEEKEKEARLKIELGLNNIDNNYTLESLITLAQIAHLTNNFGIAFYHESQTLYNVSEEFTPFQSALTKTERVITYAKQINDIQSETNVEFGYLKYEDDFESYKKAVGRFVVRTNNDLIGNYTAYFELV